MRNNGLKSMLQLALAVTAIAVYFYNTEIIIQAAKDAMVLCYTTVIPSLFVFMVISAFLSDLKCSQLLSIPFTPVFRLLNIHNRKIISYCVLSILSGFATGGYFIDKMRKEFNCSENMTGVISIIISNNSPAFIISAVGVGMLGHFSSGLILYFSIMISSFITAFIFSFLFPYSPVQSKKTNNILKSSFSAALTSSTSAIINICGVVIFAFCACKVVLLYNENLYFSLFFSILCEVTTSCKFIVDNIGKNLYLICIALSFCPLSCCLQIKSMGDNNSLSLKILLLSKLLHIPLSLTILRIAINLFPQSFAVYANGDINVNLYWNAPHISFCFLLLSLCFVILFDKQIGVFTIFRK